MNELSEKLLVEKANIVLTLMEEGKQNKLGMVKLVGANKERGFRGVTYKLNSVEAADWIKNKTNMTNFLKNMGSTANYKEQMFDIVIDWTPVTFEVEHRECWKAVEQVSDLRNESIKDIVWIKPIHLQGPGQKMAIEIFRMGSQEDANKVIKDGLFVEGKKVWGRKQVMEPRRCLKCQCYGDHKAAECLSIHKVCGRCRSHHRTSECSESNRSLISCSNCKAASNDRHTGHGC